VIPLVTASEKGLAQAFNLHM